MRNTLAAIGIAVVVAGCAGGHPSISASPSAGGSTAPFVESLASVEPPASVEPAASAASPSPTASVDVGATAPPPSARAIPDDLQRITVVQRDGIRARIELQRNPLVAGEPNWVKTTVRNLGSNDVTWFHDGCRTAVGVNGESQVDWPTGEELTGTPLSFKNRLLNVPVTTSKPWPAQLRFVPEDMLGKGTYGCADLGIAETIRPGEAIHQTEWWTGFADVRRGLPPTGPVAITGRASYYWRGHREPAAITDQTLTLSLPAWVVGGVDDDRLTPPEIVDAAVADPAFAAYLETQALGNGREEILWYDPDADVWEVGVMPWYETEPPRIHGVLVNPVTGAIRGTLDRPWDERVDPFP